MSLAPHAERPLATIPTVPTAPTGIATAVHDHTWILREALHSELGRYERWFECESCGAPHS